jgi:S1-C subfamily serine protease
MSTDWKIPSKLQPTPTDYSFDLDRALSAVVTVKSNIPADAFTASILGTERIGSGAVIRPDGLVLTIGYLITEADSIWLVSGDGRAVPGHALAVDAETGFGLVQPLGKLDLPALECGDPARLAVGDDVLLAAAGGRAHTVATEVVVRQPFAGYWEYLLDDAIFTAPAHPMWGGAALIDAQGKLAGIGSLILQQADADGRRLDRNMVVPVNLLKPVLDDMIRLGNSGRPPRPWIGFYAMENDEDELVIGGIADGGPAEKAGLQVGDEILAINDHPVSDLASVWKHLWEAGPPGTRVAVRVRRDGETLVLRAETIDRNRLLRAPLLH